MPVIKSESPECKSSVELNSDSMPTTDKLVIIDSSENTSDEDEDTDSDNSQLFQVEAIIGTKSTKDHKRQYKVHWQGYGSDADTWEPEENLRLNPNIVKLIDEYEEKHGELKSKVIIRSQKNKKPHYEEESLSEDEEWYGIRPDEGPREARNLYVADRIPSYTEKILAEIDPGVRVLRNHLRSSFIDDSSQSIKSRSRSRLKSETPSSMQSSISSTANHVSASGRKAKRGRPKKETVSPSSSHYSSDDLKDSKKVEKKKRKRDSNILKAKELNDVFTYDDGSQQNVEEAKNNTTFDAEKSKDDDYVKRKQSKHRLKRKIKKENSEGDKALDESVPKENSEDGVKPGSSKKMSLIKEKSYRDSSDQDQLKHVNKSSDKSHKKRNLDDKNDYGKLQKKIKRSSEVGIMNLACRRTVLGLEKNNKLEPLPSMEGRTDDEANFVKRLIEGKLKPDLVKQDEKSSSEQSSANTLKNSDKPNNSLKSYTSTTANLFKPTYKVPRLSSSGQVHPLKKFSVSLGTSSSDAKRPNEPIQMVQVSKTLSTGTIVDSLIPMPSTSSSGLLSNSSSNKGSLSSSSFSASCGFQNKEKFKRQRLSLLDMPLPISELPKGLEQEIAEKRAQITITPIALSQQEFELAVLSGNVEAVISAFAVEKNKLEVNGTSIDGYSLIHRVCEKACDSNHAYCDMIELLVQNGARMDVREPRDGRIPLHLAILSSCLCHVYKLLSLRSPVNLPDYADRPPIMAALERVRAVDKDDEYVNVLLRAGATFQIIFRQRTVDKRGILAHQKFLQLAFDRAIGAISLNVRVRPISPIFVNPFHETRELEHSFTIRELIMPGPNQAYCVLFCLCNMNGEKYEVRMFGYTPVQSVHVNDRPCRQLTKFVYITELKNNSNTLCVELDPSIVTALSNVNTATSRSSSAATRFGSGGRPTEFACGNLRLLTQICQLQFFRSGGAPNGTASSSKFFSDGLLQHQHKQQQQRAVVSTQSLATKTFSAPTN